MSEGPVYIRKNESFQSYILLLFVEFRVKQIESFPENSFERLLVEAKESPEQWLGNTIVQMNSLVTVTDSPSTTLVA